ncbi:MAG: nucleoside hydrolase [Ruminococcaceae bacterium]|nr:nucleoside hydrolase [Oscillospiraceae bacterium]
MAKKKIILDVDTGSDDAVAIISAVLSGEFDVLGIVCSFGNQPLKYTVPNTLQVMELLNSDIPVFAGFGVPIAQDLTPGRRMNTLVKEAGGVVDGKEVEVHEKSFSYLPPAKTKKAMEEHGVSWMLRTIKKSKEKVTVIPVGPLTNLATVLRMDPSVADNIEEIVCMGGGVYVHNITPLAEINFYNDPEAAKIVINSGVKVTIVTLDATHSSWFGYDDADKMEKIGNPAAVFAANMLRHRISSANKIGTRVVEKSALHDVLAVCAVIDPSVLTDVRHQKCDIDIGGNFADGALIVDNRPFAVPENPTYIAYKGDGEKLLNMLCSHLENF